MSAGKRARNQASITNRPTCGGNKKAGILTYSSVGNNQFISGGYWRKSMVYPLYECPKAFREGGRNQLTSAMVGRVSVTANRGRGGVVNGV